MAERRFAKPTVAAKQRFVKSFAKDASARIFPDRIGKPEICPKYPDTKENIDRHINSAGISSFGQYHCAARPPVVRGGSQQVAKEDVIVGENLTANVGSVAEELERPSALSCGGVEDLVDEATHEHDPELRRVFAFVGRENTEAGEHRTTRFSAYFHYIAKRCK